MIVFTIILLLNLIFCEKIFDDPSSISRDLESSIQFEIDRVESIEQMKHYLWPCYKREVNLTQNEWPFSICVENLQCPKDWICNYNCICEPFYKDHYIYLFEGIKDEDDPSFLENPLHWTSYSGRTKKLILKLKTDETKKLQLPIKDSKIFKEYKKGDEIRIYPSNFSYSVPETKILSWNFYHTYDIVNHSNKKLKKTRSLMICKGDYFCEEENYLISKGQENLEWSHIDEGTTVV